MDLVDQSALPGIALPEADQGDLDSGGLWFASFIYGLFEFVGQELELGVADRDRVGQSEDLVSEPRQVFVCKVRINC